MASCVFRRFPPCFCRAFPVEWKTNSSQFAFLENAVGVSRPEVLPNKQRGPSPGVFPRLGPFLYSTPFFFISNAERWLPVFRKVFACFRRASPMERKANSSQFAFVGNTVGAKRRCASAVGAEGTVCARRRRERHCVPAVGAKRRCASAVGAEGTVCPP